MTNQCVQMKFIFSLILLFLTPLLFAATSFNIAIIGKTKNDSFYQQSYQGCVTFSAKHSNINCVYDGPADFQDPRAQAIVVKTLIKKNIDAIAISVTDSDILAQRVLPLARQRNIPIMTFDSDLSPKDQDFRMAYVGTNNTDFGKAIGEQLKKMTAGRPVPQHKLICIHSGHPSTPNLNARITGIRLALSNGQTTKKLNGEYDWKEHTRCPLYSLGKRNEAVHQLIVMLNRPKNVINIAVAGFAQFSPDYINTMLPYKQQIMSKERIVISADTEQIQLDALKQGLSTMNIGQRPFEMGRQVTELLFQYLSKGIKPSKEYYYLNFHYCTTEDTRTCTNE